MSKLGRKSGRFGIGVVAFLVIAAVAWFTALRNRGPFEGELEHDFGTITMEAGETVELTHTFHLINSSDDVVEVRAARPDCGCVNAREKLPATVLPGEMFELPVRMAFSASSKKVAIYLELIGMPEQVLVVIAKADFLPKLRSNDHQIAISAGQTVAHTITLQNFGTLDAPPAPIITAPAEVESQFAGWKLIHASSAPDAQPSVWEGAIELSAQNSVSAGSSLVVTVGRSRPLTIPLVNAIASEGAPQENPAASTAAGH